MNKFKSIIIIVFIFQLLIPLRAVFNYENVLQEGKVYKFRLAAYDPHNPFKGKYLRLNPLENQFETAPIDGLNYKDPLYASLGVDSLGYAQVIDLKKQKPNTPSDFIRVRFNYKSITQDSLERIQFVYPFSEFYMNEQLSGPAEDLLREKLRDKQNIVSAEVCVKEDIAILRNVLINDRPITDWLQ